MDPERCGICEAADRDLGILIGSRSSPAPDKITNAYARLSVWVTHVRAMAGAAATHVAGLQLANLTGTAYLANVQSALADPTLEDRWLTAMRGSVQDELFASALVLLLRSEHIWPVGAHRKQSERIARSWGWSG